MYQRKFFEYKQTPISFTRAVLLTVFSFVGVLILPCKAITSEEFLADNGGVLVRVWSGITHGGETAGHVSLHTEQDYISFWPDQSSGGRFSGNLVEDLQIEGRDPEATIFLPHPAGASADGIHNDYEFLKSLLAQGKCRWNIVGEVQSLKHSFTQEAYDRMLQLLRNPFKSPISRHEQRLLSLYETWSFNCASLVINLLEHNGYVKKHSTLNTAVAPDRVAKICAETFLQKMMFPQFDSPRGYNHYDLFRVLDQQLRGKGGEGFGSHHVELFGRKALLSVENDITVNLNLLADVIREITIERKANSIQRTIARVAVSQGFTEIIAQMLTKK